MLPNAAIFIVHTWRVIRARHGPIATRKSFDTQLNEKAHVESKRTGFVFSTRKNAFTVVSKL